jgi:hypothetical protein
MAYPELRLLKRMSSIRLTPTMLSLLMGDPRKPEPLVHILVELKSSIPSPWE